MIRISTLEGRPVSFVGFQVLFLMLLFSVFLQGFFIENAMRTSEELRENPVNPVNLARIILIGFVGLCLIGVFLLRSSQFTRNFKGPLGWMIVYAAIALASAAYSSLPLVSAGKAFEVLVDVLFFVAVSSFCTSLEVNSLWDLLLFFLSAYLTAVWISALVMPSVGFIHIPGALLPLQLQGAYPTNSPNDIGEISAIVAATAFYRLLLKRRSAIENEGLLWGGILVLGIVSLIFAQARTSVIELAAALIAILLMTRKSRLLPLLLVSGAILFVAGGASALREYLMRGQSSELFYSMSGRLSIWDVAWTFFKESPLIGHGFFTAHRLDLNIRLTAISVNVSTIDNTFLEVLLGVGLIGLLPILAGLFQLASWLLRIARKAGLGGRMRECRCEIVGVLIIVIIRAVNGPTFQGHSISLLILLISMAFAHTALRVQVAKQRSRIQRSEFYRRLIVPSSDAQVSTTS
jgi:O-antigen ligase